MMGRVACIKINEEVDISLIYSAYKKSNQGGTNRIKVLVLINNTKVIQEYCYFKTNSTISSPPPTIHLNKE